MMAAILLLSALGLLVLPGLLRPLARRLPPAEWAGLCALLLAAGAIMLEVLVVLIATPTVMRVAGLQEIADLCREALSRLMPGQALVGWAALVVAATLPVLASREALRARRARRIVRVAVEPARGERRAHDGHALLVMSSDRLVAFSVPGPAPEMVISRRLADELTDSELTAASTTASYCWPASSREAWGCSGRSGAARRRCVPRWSGGPTSRRHWPPPPAARACAPRCCAWSPR